VLPPPRADIEHRSSLRVFDVILNDKLTAANHVTALLSSGSSMLYAIRMLCSHSTPTTSLQDIFRATVISRILYAAPSWSGMCSAADHVRLDSLLRRSKRYCRSDMPVISELFSTADDDFFQRVKTNSNHVLQPYLSQHTVTPYQLRTRPHNITLINKTKFLNDTDFIIRLLYKFSY